MEKFYKIEKVADYLDFRNQKPSHPLIGLVNFYQLNNDLNRVNTVWDGLDFHCYAIFLKDNANCKLKYGGSQYDFDEGTMVFIGPNQRVGMVKGEAYKPKGYALLFHPDLLKGSALEKGISQYSYFSYSVKEALHLSNKEREVIVSLLDKLNFELEQNTDKHSKKLILSNLTLLLDYCMRFYDRQFITRELPHHLAMNRNDIFVGGIRPHYYCLPILKRETHRNFLVNAATSGNPKFFLGTDTAPHLKFDKENECGCAGVFNATYCISILAQVFDNCDALNNLEKFTSVNGAKHYNLELNTEKFQIVKRIKPIEFENNLSVGDQKIVIFKPNFPVYWEVNS